MFMIDGSAWEYPIDVTRNPDIRASEVSGEMLDGSYYNDVRGTYMNYTVKVVGPLNQRDALYSLYEQISAPVPDHTFTLPYNNDTVIVVGRVEGISDVYVRLSGGAQYWRGLQFNIIANVPTKDVTLSGIVARGRQLMPSAADNSEGDTWVWHDGAWVRGVSYENADIIRF